MRCNVNKTSMKGVLATYNVSGSKS